MIFQDKPKIPSPLQMISDSAASLQQVRLELDKTNPDKKYIHEQLFKVSTKLIALESTIKRLTE
ncbi:hypothetical protein D1872_51980 [compost metagenome]